MINFYFYTINFFLAFFSMQTPTIYIIILMMIFTAVIFFKNKDYLIIKQFTLGTCLALIFLIIYLFLTNTDVNDLIYQYFLFPMSIAEGRISSDTSAYVKLIDQLNLKRVFGNFKFIHIFLLPLIFLQLVK